MRSVKDHLLFAFRPLFAEWGHAPTAVEVPRSLFLALWSELGDAAVSWEDRTLPEGEAARFCRVRMYTPWGVLEVRPSEPIEVLWYQTAKLVHENMALEIRRRDETE